MLKTKTKITVTKNITDNEKWWKSGGTTDRQFLTVDK